MPAAFGNLTKSRHARLFVSLGLSLALHVTVLQIVPGMPPWLHPGSEKQAAGQEIKVTFAAPRQVLPQTEPSVQHVEPSPSPATEPRATEIKTTGPRDTEPRATQPNTSSESATATAQPAGMFPGPWYYPARYLHRRPTPLKPIWPVYPEELAEVRGRVTILLLISEEGKVDQYRILASDPPDLFDMSVIAAFTAAQYAPALITGYKVKSQLLAEVSFEPGAPPRADFSIMEPVTVKPIQDSSKSLGKEN